jgi:ParB-like chromosome segregation protein Spo0J
MAVRGKIRGKAPARQARDVKHGELRLAVEVLPIGDLTPDPDNARHHSDDQVSQIAGSIAQFGFNDPIGIAGPENRVIEGHGRLMAAHQLKLDEVPVIRLDHMTADELDAYAIGHNKIALNSSWDGPKLASKLAHLQGLGQLEGTTLPALAGFESREVRALLEPKAGDGRKAVAFNASQFTLSVSCRDANERDALMARLQDEGYTVKEGKA